MKKLQLLIVCITVIVFQSCSSPEVLTEYTPFQQKSVKIISLGDSYTIGESVCTSCRFPEQLRDSLIKKTKNNSIYHAYSLKIIAQTGWTTSNLLSAITNENPDFNNDLVTLLIGVNNQYQNKPFSLYESEFPTLVNKAIQLAKGDKSKVIIISIPDYTYTPFGNGNTTISTLLDAYNNYAANYALQNNISFVIITDITRWV